MKHSKLSPFDLKNEDTYQRWRELKLQFAKTKQNKQVIILKKTPPHFLSDLDNSVAADNLLDQFESKTNSILKECSNDNYCLYSLTDHQKFDVNETKKIIYHLAKKCGISKLDNNICADEDNLSSICKTNHKDQHEYIPYSDKRMSWHTDGYYNRSENTIHSMLLHCYQEADNGGESSFMDHEIAYILLRDQNPKWITALSELNVMTIPANVLNAKVIRPEQTGPVFSITPQGHLHMRYSARQRNIIWQQNKHTLDALSYLQQILTSSVSTEDNESKYIIRYKLKAGEGIISRNVLHCRNAFEDPAKSSSSNRLLFRGRFYDELPRLNV